MTFFPHFLFFTMFSFFLYLFFVLYFSPSINGPIRHIFFHCQRFSLLYIHHSSFSKQRLFRYRPDLPSSHRPHSRHHGRRGKNQELGLLQVSRGVFKWGWGSKEGVAPSELEKKWQEKGKEWHIALLEKLYIFENRIFSLEF